MIPQIIKTITFTASIIGASLITSCTNKTTSDATETATTHEGDENVVTLTEAQTRAIGIETGSVTERDISNTLKVSGYIDVPPQALQSVTSQMGGIVRTTPLLQGSFVKKGQVIAVLENQEYVQLQQDYLESVSQLSTNEAEYRRQETLAAQNVNSKKTLQQARNQFEIARIRERALRQRLLLININPGTLSASNIRSTVNIYSPASGYVTKVNVNPGKFVNPNDVMFEIVDGSDLHVELNVFEKDAALVKAGQRVRFTLAGENTERLAVVALVGKEIRSDKTFTVHAIAQGAKNFIPNTYLKAYIETGEHRETALPLGAVVEFQDRKYIFITTQAAHKHQDREQGDNSEPKIAEKDFYFELVEVKVGNSDDAWVQVELPSGRSFQDKIVIKGAYDLLSALKNSEEHEGH